MILTALTNHQIRKAFKYKFIEVAERENSGINMLFGLYDDPLADLHPLIAGMEIPDDLGLVEIELYFYDSNHGYESSEIVWIFECEFEGQILQTLYLNWDDVPNELTRAVVQIAAHEKLADS